MKPGAAVVRFHLLAPKIPMRMARRLLAKQSNAGSNPAEVSTVFSSVEEQETLNFLVGGSTPSRRTMTKHPWTQRGPIESDSWLEVRKEIDAALYNAMIEVWKAMSLLPDELVNPTDGVYTELTYSIGHLGKARVNNKEP